jgi:RNA polymerase sigma factor (sigma-70 family)
MTDVVQQPRRIAALEDLTLAQLASAGDKPAFTELVRRAAGPTRALLRHMGAGSATADDMVQDALLIALRQIASYRGDAKFASWLMTIAARHYLRRRKLEARTILVADPTELAEMEGEDNSSPAEYLDLYNALATLPPQQRMCISLCHGAGLTHEEIARTLEVPEGTVKSHVRRGLQKLKAILTSEGSDNG